MAIRPGDTVIANFTTSDPTTGSLEDADSTPTGTLVRNGDDTATTVTVANVATGRYTATFTVPSSWTAGDDVSLFAEATVNGTDGGDYVWWDSLEAATTGASSGGEVVSATSSYLSADDFVLFVDYRLPAQWLSNTQAALTLAALKASDELDAFLRASSGELEAAVLAGLRMTAADIVTLINENCNAGVLIKDILAGLTLGRCWAHRPRTSDEPYPIAATWAREMIEQLYQGRRIFGLQATVEAGVMNHDLITKEQVQTRSLATSRMRRGLGPRGDMMDPLP